MGGSLLAAAGLCYFGGVGAFSVSAGYVLAPFVQSLRSPSRMAGALQCKEPDTPPGSEELQLVAPPKAGAQPYDHGVGMAIGVGMSDDGDGRVRLWKRKEQTTNKDECCRPRGSVGKR